MGPMLIFNIQFVSQFLSCEKYYTSLSLQFFRSFKISFVRQLQYMIDVLRAAFTFIYYAYVLYSWGDLRILRLGGIRPFYSCYFNHLICCFPGDYHLLLLRERELRLSILLLDLRCGNTNYLLHTFVH